MSRINRAANNILETIGGTPLVRISNLYSDCDFQVFAKIEAGNPGGSLKDRPAHNIIKKAFSQGLVTTGSTIIESSSGNMGIGLAQVCAYHKLRFICVVDPKTTVQNIAILKAFGATVDLVVEPDPKTGEFLGARIARVKELVREIPNSFWPNQYSNIANSEAHFETMGEITDALDSKVDYLFCAVSTCGTMSGCATYIRRHHLTTKLWAVDAVGSVLFGGARAKRQIPGHGASLVPELYKPNLEDAHIRVTDLDCIRGCRRLVAEESILAGGSSGGIVSALGKVRERIPRNSTCVLILPDRGERYLDTIYSDLWVRDHFGEEALAEKDMRLAQPSLRVPSCASIGRKGLAPRFQNFVPPVLD
ncbi:MAG TPA: 2,3-diaminopropionate biosynthesis protein SbnA [Blastocatellia bacterium]|nr:2,3-diaminopropionate biosynthesis protein SbnA [Blastocatellia bacterium]